MQPLLREKMCIRDRARRIHTQRPKDKNKLYALHAPEVECIGKGKARQPYEFGVKVNPSQNTAATVVRIWANNGSTTATDTNSCLLYTSRCV